MASDIPAFSWDESNLKNLQTSYGNNSSYRNAWDQYDTNQIGIDINSEKFRKVCKACQRYPTEQQFRNWSIMYGRVNSGYINFDQF